MTMVKTMCAEHTLIMTSEKSCHGRSRRYNSDADPRKHTYHDVDHNDNVVLPYFCQLLGLPESEDSWADSAWDTHTAACSVQQG